MLCSVKDIHDGLFNGATFDKEARFTNTCFGKGCNFTKVKFSERTDFTGVYSKSKSVPIFESVRFARHQYGDGETFWRFIKQASQEAGHYQLAGEGFYNERCAHFWRKLRGSDYEQLSVFKKILKIIWGVRLLPELVLGRLKAKGYKVVHLKPKAEAKTLAEYDAMIEKDMKGMAAGNERPMSSVIRTIEEAGPAPTAAAKK